MMMNPIRPIHHSLQTDAGESRRAVLGNYPLWRQGDLPGWYYQLASLNIVPCVFTGRWQTLSQWEAIPGLYENLPDALGTT